MKKLQIVRNNDRMPTVGLMCEYIKPENGYLYAMNDKDEIIGVFQIGTFEMAVLLEERKGEE